MFDKSLKVVSPSDVFSLNTYIFEAESYIGFR